MTTPAVQAFKRGCSIAEVAVFLSTTPKLLGSWLEEGSSPDCKDAALVSFTQACAAARNEYRGGLREDWRLQCKAEWKALAIEMKAQFPDEYDRGTQKKVDITVTKKTAGEDLRGLTDEELALKDRYEAMLEAAAQRRALGK